VHPTQPIEIFGNVSAPCNTLVTWQHPGKILRRSSQGNPSVGGLNQRVVEKFSDFAPISAIFLRINLTNFVQFRQYKGKSGPRRTTLVLFKARFYSFHYNTARQFIFSIFGIGGWRIVCT